MTSGNACGKFPGRILARPRFRVLLYSNVPTIFTAGPFPMYHPRLVPRQSCQRHIPDSESYPLNIVCIAPSSIQNAVAVEPQAPLNPNTPKSLTPYRRKFVSPFGVT